jgi:hypothetical protein
MRLSGLDCYGFEADVVRGLGSALVRAHRERRRMNCSSVSQDRPISASKSIRRTANSTLRIN